LEEDTDVWLRVSNDIATKQLRLAEESDVEMEGEGDNCGGESDDDEMDDGDN
jgi:hypothetical protein